MKKTFLLLLLACVASIMPSMAQNNPPYVIPMAADGTFVKDGSDYTGKMQMTATDGGYVLNDVTLYGGLLFLGENTEGTYSTLYGMPTWAVTPALLTFANPLEIVGNDSDYIPVEDGTYNIYFYDREISGQTYHTFALMPSDNPNETVYPASVYLVNGTSIIEVPGSDGDYWVYTSLPQQFKVSYEPRDNSAFEFGPTTVSDASLEAHTPVSIALGENTGTSFSYAADGGLESGMNAIVKVNLVDNTLNIEERVPTGLADMETDENRIIFNGNTISLSGPSEKAVYDITGQAVLMSKEHDVTGSLNGGMYVVRMGDTVKKILIGRD